jgi:uncharacterized glyoxalase superfamily protein PhnB
MSIAPVLPVRDVRSSASFYARHLGFSIAYTGDGGDYAVVERDGQSVHMADASASPEALQAARENVSFVITVDDLDRTWDSVRATEPPVKMRAPEKMAWGVREFHMYDLDGCLLRFQARGPATSARQVD